MPLRTALSALALALASHSVHANERAVLVLDASGSMWQPIDGRSKVDVAREAVGGMLQRWNPDTALGLMAYGHRRRGDCADIEVLIEPTSFDRATMTRTVRGLNALGIRRFGHRRRDAQASTTADQAPPSVSSRSAARRFPSRKCWKQKSQTAWNPA